MRKPTPPRPRLPPPRLSFLLRLSKHKDIRCSHLTAHTTSVRPHLEIGASTQRPPEHLTGNCAFCVQESSSAAGAAADGGGCAPRSPGFTRGCRSVDAQHPRSSAASTGVLQHKEGRMLVLGESRHLVSDNTLALAELPHKQDIQTHQPAPGLSAARPWLNPLRATSLTFARLPSHVSPVSGALAEWLPPY